MPIKRTTSAETSARFLSMYRPSTRVSRWRKTHVAKREECASCGGTEFVDAVDNFGRSYRGCARCRCLSAAELRRVLLDSRIKLDFARATVAECLDCVSARINECHARGVEPDHITNIAWQMLNDALHGETA